MHKRIFERACHIRHLSLYVLMIGCLSVYMVACKKNNTPSPESELVIFHAGSLSVPFHEISTEFNKRYPNIHIKAEVAGSRACARKICDLKMECDVIGSADYKVISTLLMPEYADFNVRFATNEMVIAYTDKSRFNLLIGADNWQEILLREKVSFGRSEPNLDPCGY